MGIRRLPTYRSCFPPQYVHHVVCITESKARPGCIRPSTPCGSAGPAVDLFSGRGLGVAHPAVVALPDGGALAAYDVVVVEKRRICLARLTADGRRAGHVVVVDGSEDGKYPQLAVLNDTVAVVGWTTSNGDKTEMRLARVDFRGVKAVRQSP